MFVEGDMQDLIDRYLSEQISESEWQKLLKDTPGLREAWVEHFTPLGNFDGMKLVMRTAISEMENEIGHLSACLEKMRRVLNGYKNV